MNCRSWETLLAWEISFLHLLFLSLSFFFYPHTAPSLNIDAQHSTTQSLE